MEMPESLKEGRGRETREPVEVFCVGVRVDSHRELPALGAYKASNSKWWPWGPEVGMRTRGKRSLLNGVRWKFLCN